jgi:hypothetical protein
MPNYHFSSPLRVVWNEKGETFEDTLGDEGVKRLESYLEAAFAEIMDSIAPESVKITKIAFTVDWRLLPQVLVCTVTSEKALTKKQQKEVLRMLEGQYSDGVGECLEQEALLKDGTGEVFVHLFSDSKKWAVVQL